MRMYHTGFQPYDAIAIHTQYNNWLNKWVDPLRLGICDTCIIDAKFCPFVSLYDSFIYPLWVTGHEFICFMKV